MNEPFLLREVEAGDLPLFFQHQRDPVAVAMVAFRSRDRAEFDEHWRKILRDETVVKRTIVVDGRVAGSILSFVREGIREVGYWLDQKFWGRGIATEALRAFLFLDPARPLYAVTARFNHGSQRVLEKCGFSPCHPAPQISKAADESIAIFILPGEKVE